MTAKEVFERYEGKLIRSKIDDVFRCICGYSEEYNGLIVERSENELAMMGTYSRDKFVQAGWVVSPDLPNSWRGFWADVNKFDLDSIQASCLQNLCCRCGSNYKSKRAHRLTCKV